MEGHKKTFAVVMGDLVASETAGDVEALHAIFNRAVDRQNHLTAANLASPLTITLGDEFQGLARSLSAALAIVRGVRFDLMREGIDCRFVIGLTMLQTPLNPRQAWNMIGPGLAAARERLDQKRADNLYRFSLPDEPVAEPLLDGLGASLTAIERGWTGRQRLDIAAMLGGDSAAAIAQLRGVSTHSVYKVRNAGNFDLYKSQWAAIKTALAAIDRKHSL